MNIFGLCVVPTRATTPYSLSRQSTDATESVVAGPLDLDPVPRLVDAREGEEGTCDVCSRFIGQGDGVRLILAYDVLFFHRACLARIAAAIERWFTYPDERS